MMEGGSNQDTVSLKSVSSYFVGLLQMVKQVIQHSQMAGTARILVAGRILVLTEEGTSWGKKDGPVQDGPDYRV